MGGGVCVVLPCCLVHLGLYTDVDVQFGAHLQTRFNEIDTVIPLVLWGRGSSGWSRRRLSMSLHRIQKEKRRRTTH